MISKKKNKQANVVPELLQVYTGKALKGFLDDLRLEVEGESSSADTAKFNDKRVSDGIRVFFSSPLVCFMRHWTTAWLFSNKEAHLVLCRSIECVGCILTLWRCIWSLQGRSCNFVIACQKRPFQRIESGWMSVSWCLQFSQVELPGFKEKNVIE